MWINALGGGKPDEWIKASEKENSFLWKWFVKCEERVNTKSRTFWVDFARFCFFDTFLRALEMNAFQGENATAFLAIFFPKAFPQMRQIYSIPKNPSMSRKSGE